MALAYVPQHGLEVVFPFIEIVLRSSLSFVTGDVGAPVQTVADKYADEE